MKPSYEELERRLKGAEDMWAHWQSKAEVIQGDYDRLKKNETAWRIGYNSALANCQSENPDIYKLGQHIALLHLASGGRDLAFEEEYEPLDTIP